MYRAALLSLTALLPLAANAAPDASVSGRLAEVEVVDSRSGRELPVYRHRGRWYVAGEPGREYEIRVRNARDERLLAVTSVDGVNVVSGQTANPRQSGYVLNPWDAVTIEGWRKSLSRVARFYFTDLGDSYAARTGRPENVGVIGVALYRERARRWAPQLEQREESSRNRHGESSAPRAKSHGGAPSAPEPQLGTGHGRNEWSEARTTAFERASDRPAEVITIYYDSHRNLVAQGVIPEERRWARRSRPEPFPAGFVPDPWR